MRLALHTDYALRTLLYLAANPGRASVGEVAEFYRISKDHVAKVVQTLARQGYVRSIRGIGGGIELARRPDEIRVGQVILDCEGNMHLLECVGIENVCVIQPGCKLKTVLAKAERIQLEYLQSVKLSDLLTPGVTLLQIRSQGSGVRGRESGKRVQRTKDRGQIAKVQRPKSQVGKKKLPDQEKAR